MKYRYFSRKMDDDLFRFILRVDENGFVQYTAIPLGNNTNTEWLTEGHYNVLDGIINTGFTELDPLSDQMLSFKSFVWAKAWYDITKEEGLKSSKLGKEIL